MSETITGRTAMMLDHEQMRIEYRDRAVAMSSARRAFDENWNRSKIDDQYQAERAAMRCAEMAAYYAVQKERELHIEDMRMLNEWMKLRVNELNVRPLSMVAAPPPTSS